MEKTNAYAVYEKFLTECVNHNKKVKIITVNGYQMTGKIAGFDSISIFFNEVNKENSDKTNTSLIFRSNISTIRLEG